MSYRPKGKYVRIDKSHPEALGICDYSGLAFNRKDLVRQMQWRGNALVWTGFYVGRPFLDVPNEQARPPILPPDPIPVKDPRPQQCQQMTHANNTLGTINDITWTHASLWNNEDGIQALPYAQALTTLENAYWGA